MVMAINPEPKKQDVLSLPEETFRLLVSSIKDYAIFMMTPEGIVASWNEGAERIKGYRAEEIIGQHFSKFYPQEAIDSDFPAEELKLACQYGRFEDEGWRIRKDGSQFWANVIITPVLDEHEQLIGYAKVTRDLTERKKIEDSLRQNDAKHQALVETLKKQTTQLETMNRELEAFSYSVSHDLRAPLRSMDGYSQALLEDYGDRLDQSGQYYLQRIRANSQHMAKLIDDLLNLAYVSRTELQCGNIDLSRLAAEIIAEQLQWQVGRDVAIEIQPNLTAVGDPGLLKIVLYNLLDNALKFTRDKQPGRIKFGKEEQSGTTVFYVRDNGTGFEMAYANQLFAAFHRLHGQDFPGTGIGLATVQRILNRHGGNIWVESKPDEGTTFYFVIPLPSKQQTDT
jgi:PAS domain S-box-containing protein